MMSASDFNYLFNYFQASADQLEEYLLSEQLFWNLNINPPFGGPTYPKLTLGGMLLSEAQLQPLIATVSQSTKFMRAQNSVEATRSRWQVAWREKAGWEFKSRLNQWQHFLKDYFDKPEEFSVDYAYNVRLRVMLALLQPEAGEIPTEQLDLLAEQDQLLRAQFIPGEFCWDSDLAPGFPKEEYWYLWGSLSEESLS